MCSRASTCPQHPYLSFIPVRAQVSNLQCKLESKSKALVILSQDLVEVKRERDEYKLMAEQIRDRYQSLKKRIKQFSPSISLTLGDQTHHSLVEQIASNTPLAHVLLELTEQNKYLLFEVEELKTKLVDADGEYRPYCFSRSASNKNNPARVTHNPPHRGNFSLTHLFHLVAHNCSPLTTPH